MPQKRINGRRVAKYASPDAKVCYVKVEVFEQPIV